MGILSNHVPSIEALRPGVVEVIEEGGKTEKFFGECTGLLKRQCTECARKERPLAARLVAVISGSLHVSEQNTTGVFSTRFASGEESLG